MSQDQPIIDSETLARAADRAERDAEFRTRRIAAEQGMDSLSRLISERRLEAEEAWRVAHSALEVERARMMQELLRAERQEFELRLQLERRFFGLQLLAASAAMLMLIVGLGVALIVAATKGDHLLAIGGAAAALLVMNLWRLAGYSTGRRRHVRLLSDKVRAATDQEHQQEPLQR